MSSFKDLRIVDNFYQTSSYYPMPTVMISTLAEDGSTSVGSYSLFSLLYCGKELLCNDSRSTKFFQYGTASAGWSEAGSYQLHAGGSWLS